MYVYLCKSWGYGLDTFILVLLHFSVFMASIILFSHRSDIILKSVLSNQFFQKYEESMYVVAWWLIGLILGADSIKYHHPLISWMRRSAF